MNVQMFIRIHVMKMLIVKTHLEVLNVLVQKGILVTDQIVSVRLGYLTTACVDLSCHLQVYYGKYGTIKHLLYHRLFQNLCFVMFINTYLSLVYVLCQNWKTSRL